MGVTSPEKGVEKGIEKGTYQTKVNIAVNLLKRGFSVADVAMNTGLTEPEVRQLKEDSAK